MALDTQLEGKLLFTLLDKDYMGPRAGEHGGHKQGPVSMRLIYGPGLLGSFLVHVPFEAHVRKRPSDTADPRQVLDSPPPILSPRRPTSRRQASS